MHSLSDDEKREVLGEVLADELKAIHELVSHVPVITKKVNTLDHNIQIIKSDVKAIKAVVKNHEARLTHLGST